ncbi:MAG: 50S ribosomal protein L3 [Verrucomicrobiales bacterium]
MSIGIIGKKVGMTRIFNEEGVAVAVTVIDISDNVFLQKKTSEKDGYTALQLGYGDQKESRLNRAELGHLKASGSKPKRKILEFRLESDEQLPEVSHPGLDLFDEGQWVDVIGTSKGKGFQGVMRRFNFSGQPQAHGHMMHRRTGGIGAGTDPGRVWKGKAMPGRQGNDRKTVQNLKIVQKRPADNVILVSGAVPGANGGYVVIRPAKKKEGPVRNLKAGGAPAAATPEEGSES